MSTAQVTLLLRQASEGRNAAIADLFPLVYAELRALAESYLRRERSGHTLQATALVHEAYLKLVEQREAHWHDRAHFFAVAAQAIRRILVDHARGKGRAKRGGGSSAVSLDHAEGVPADETIDVLALDEALTKLSALCARHARVIELRFFAGLTVDEAAHVLGVAPSTVGDDWAMARAWLREQLSENTGS